LGWIVDLQIFDWRIRVGSIDTRRHTEPGAIATALKFTRSLESS
jgi:hypothetical protein